MAGCVHSLKKRVASQIEALIFDDVLNDFGGLRVLNNAFKDREMHVQVPGDNVDLDKVQLDSSFQELKENQVEFLDKILDNFSDYTMLSPTNIEAKFDDTLTQLMMVKIYIERWYGVEIEGGKLSDSLYYESETADNVLEIANKFKRNPQLMDSNVTAKTYQSELSVYFQFQTVKELVESFVMKNAKTTDYDSWFKGYFGGSDIELKATIQQLKISTWDKISGKTSDLIYGNHLLPHLTMRNPKNMIIANCKGRIIYSTKHNFQNHEKEVLQALKDFDYYLNTMINTQYSEVNRNRIISNLNTVPIYDSEISDKNYNYFDEDNSLSNGFFKVLYQLTSIGYNWWEANAVANSKEVIFIQAILTNNYCGTLAHEYFHNTGGLIMNSGNIGSNWGYRSPWQKDLTGFRIVTDVFKNQKICKSFTGGGERGNGPYLWTEWSCC